MDELTSIVAILEQQLGPRTEDFGILTFVWLSVFFVNIIAILRRSGLCGHNTVLYTFISPILL
ncbi:uncharacterized protein FIBRA_04358 [Fibroporia radiculosa]|uniref:Uncharacterized protein n=1 Tax=Fibroporia radiculosa TaxID=599839 RepID=J4G788_9APHY|nr:uncharacterized protein FIBRA_04358 [Fibroporia radiculosa]CCM02273.1 predicted protein [Fibroporia radiculosa]